MDRAHLLATIPSTIKNGDGLRGRVIYYGGVALVIRWNRNDFCRATYGVIA